MVKRAEDGRCLVVCRIWVSDLGLRPAVGRLARQETCFLGRLSFSFPSRPPFRLCSLLGPSHSVPPDEPAAACYAPFLALSRTENAANRTRARFSWHCPLGWRSLKFPDEKVFREMGEKQERRNRKKERKDSPHR